MIRGKAAVAAGVALASLVFARAAAAAPPVPFVLKVVNPNGAALRYLGSNPGVSRKHGHEYCWTIRAPTAA
jgi:hypothetical protein